MLAHPDGRLVYLIASSGGMFDIGEKIFPIPWQGLYMYLSGSHDVVLEVTHWTLYNGPSFEPGPWPDLLSEEWESGVYGYYGVERKKAQGGKNNWE